MNVNGLNGHPDLVLWFDDLGTGNEEYRFLSNFYEGETINLPGVTWENLLVSCGQKQALDRLQDWRGPIPFKTGEHAFQAMKFWGTDYTHFYDIVSAADPNSSKALGRSRQHPLREDWEVVKLDLMAAIIRTKFTLDREEGPRLLATGDKMLVEGTWWYDDVWGVNLNSKDLPGRNWLGTLLMVRRAELRVLNSDSASALAKHFAKNTDLYNMEFSR